MLFTAGFKLLAETFFMVKVTKRLSGKVFNDGKYPFISFAVLIRLQTKHHRLLQYEAIIFLSF